MLWAKLFFGAMEIMFDIVAAVLLLLAWRELKEGRVIPALLLLAVAVFVVGCIFGLIGLVSTL